jgi:hypothetical protein
LRDFFNVFARPDGFKSPSSHFQFADFSTFLLPAHVIVSPADTIWFSTGVEQRRVDLAEPPQS